MADINEYITALTAALEEKRDWLDKTALANLKDSLRIYQSSFASLYSIFLKKKLINEDPYKHETKIGEIEVPPTEAFNDAKLTEQLSIRLATFDNQLDFLVNFYQFAVDFLNLDRIKRILGLIRFIDWSNLVPDSQSPNTRAVAEITNQSKVGLDQIALRVIGEALVKLPKSTAEVANIMKHLALYHRETYKLKVRTAVTGRMSASDATAANIKKKIASEMPGSPFFQELVEEIIKEDFSDQGDALRESIMKSLAVAQEKPKAVKKPVSYRSYLMDGIRVIGNSASALNEIYGKIDENETTLANQKKSGWERLKELLRQMIGREAEERLIDLQYMDPVKAVPVRIRLNYHQFRADMEKRIRLLSSISVQGSATAKLDAMSEEQLIALLEKTVREVQSLHRTLSALDEFHKAEAPKELREKIKGIRPELATVKNSFVKANQLRHEYSARLEEEEQMKKLGITPNA